MTLRPGLLSAQPEERPLEPYRRVWRTAALEAFLMLALTAAIMLAARLVNLPTDETTQQAFAVGFSVLPVLLWLLISYRAERGVLSRRRRLVPTVILSGLAASGVAVPVVNQLFNAEDWLSTASGLTRIIGYTLTVGLVHESLKYAVMRFALWPGYFRTRQDAIAYSMAAGLGFATALNLVLAFGENLSIESAALRMTETTLAQVAITPILGFALYELRRVRASVFLSPVAVLVAGVFNALSIVIRAGLIVGTPGVTSTGNAAFLGLGMAVFLVVVLFSSVGFLVGNADERDELRRRESEKVLFTEPDEPLNRRQRWAGYLTVAVVLGGVVAGFSYRSNVIDAVFPFINREVGVRALYPARWLLEEGGTRFVLRATDPGALPYKTALQLRLIPIGEGARPAEILDLLDVDRAGRLPAYRSLGRSPITLGGLPGLQMTYAFAYTEPNPFLNTEPVTVRAVDIVVLRPGQAVVITYEAEAAAFERHRHYFTAFVRSLQF